MAFDLPAEVIDDLAGIQKTIAAGGVKIGWVAPQNIHLTVKFLGEISPEAVQKALAAAEQAVKRYRGHFYLDPRVKPGGDAGSGTRGAPMRMTARGIGVFPDMNRPRVLWAGLSGDLRSLVDFHGILDENLFSAGFGKEKRRFTAHVTLGRIKRAVDVRQLAAVMAPCLDFQSKPFCIDRLMVYKSDLTAAGPVYSRLAAFVLGG
jgi:2'-5' RNA ligase